MTYVNITKIDKISWKNGGIDEFPKRAMQLTIIKAISLILFDVSEDSDDDNEFIYSDDEVL